MVIDGVSLTKNSKTFERKLMGVRSPFPFPLHVSQLSQPLPKGGEPALLAFSGAPRQITNSPTLFVCCVGATSGAASKLPGRLPMNARRSITG